MEKVKWERGAIMRTRDREEGAMELLGAEPKGESRWSPRTPGGLVTVVPSAVLTVGATETSLSRELK